MNTDDTDKEMEPQMDTDETQIGRQGKASMQRNGLFAIVTNHGDFLMHVGAEVS